MRAPLLIFARLCARVIQTIRPIPHVRIAESGIARVTSRVAAEYAMTHRNKRALSITHKSHGVAASPVRCKGIFVTGASSIFAGTSGVRNNTTVEVKERKAEFVMFDVAPPRHDVWD